MAGAGRCASCGAELPAGAGFCPRCGTAVGSVPVIPLVGEGPSSAPRHEPATTPTSARTLAVLLIVGLAVVVGLSFLAGGDDGDDEEEFTAPSTTTTSRPTTSTTRPPATSTSTSVPPGGVPAPEPLLAEGVVMDDGYGMAIVAVTGDGLVAVDPTTGVELALGGPESTLGVRQVMWTGDALVVLADQRLWRYEDDTTWRELDLAERRVDWIDDSGAIFLSSGGPVADLAAVAPDGTVSVVEGPSTLWGAAGAFGLTADGAVVSTFDGIFLVRDGASRRIATGRALGVGGDRLLRHSCDDAMICRVSIGTVRDADLTDEITLAPLPGALELWAGGVSPDGRRAWVMGWNPEDPRETTWVGDERRWVGIPTVSVRRETLRWSTDGRALLWVDEAPALNVAQLEELGASGREPLLTFPLDRGRLRSGDTGWLLTFVPLDALPFGS